MHLSHDLFIWSNYIYSYKHTHTQVENRDLHKVKTNSEFMGCNAVFSHGAKDLSLLFLDLSLFYSRLMITKEDQYFRERKKTPPGARRCVCVCVCMCVFVCVCFLATSSNFSSSFWQLLRKVARSCRINLFEQNTQ